MNIPVIEFRNNSSNIWYGENRTLEITCVENGTQLLIPPGESYRWPIRPDIRSVCTLGLSNEDYEFEELTFKVRAIKRET